VGTVRFIVLGGFLGAGKTTAITWLARSLQANAKRTAVVMNDQGERLVDTAYGQASGLSVAEVTGGCFCCRFDDLARTTIALVERDGVEVVLAEAVGSCTDLTATVIRPLRAYFGERFSVAPLTVLVDPVRLGDLHTRNAGVGALMTYLFDKQLEDGRILALNKRDLLPAGRRAELETELERRFPAADVLSVSAATGSGMDQLRDRLLATGSDGAAEPGLRTIDYATYAEAEAELAWLNAEVVIQAEQRSSDSSAAWLRAFAAELSDRCAQQGLWVGHVKAYLTTPNGGSRSKVSVVRAGEAPLVDLEDAQPFTAASLLVNARVRARPADLDAVVLASLADVDRRRRTTSTVASLRSFSPPPPRPTFRLALRD
jgi:G3E family GTPase